MDEVVAEACYEDYHSSDSRLSEASPSDAAAQRLWETEDRLFMAERTAGCVQARVDRARKLCSHGHIKAAMRDYAVAKKLDPGSFGLLSKNALAREYQQVSTAIAMQQEGRRQLDLAVRP
jgi:hypothetical protein